MVSYLIFALMGIGDTAMKDTTVSLKQAAAACDAAFKLHIPAMTSRTQSIQINPCFNSSMKDLLEAGFDNGDSIALSEIARRAVRNDMTTEAFLGNKFKGMQRTADKAAEVATPKAAPKAKAEVVKAVVAPTVVATPSKAEAIAQLLALLGLTPPVVAAPVAVAPAAIHPDLARNCKVLVADAIRLKDRNGLKNALVELELIPEGCRKRFDALVKVAEQLNVNVKKHKAPASVPNLQVGNTKFTKFVN
jgi:hypothetical protein